jgi:hypothetical protein
MVVLKTPYGGSEDAATAFPALPAAHFALGHALLASDNTTSP